MSTQTDYTSVFKAAEVELVYRTKVKASERPRVSKSRDAVQILRNAWEEDKMELQEQCKVLLLNKGLRVLGIYDLSCGAITDVLVDVRLVYCAALKANATAVMICHNHPSGSLRVSDGDKKITNKLKLAGDILNIEFLDHIIITSEGYLSFADEGLL